MLGVVALINCQYALDFDLITDDIYHRAVLIGSDKLPESLNELDKIPGPSGELKTALFGQFDFMRQHNVERLIDKGILPWWTYRKLNCAFFRPVSSFTHWLDYRLFPDSPKLMHLHNLLWFSVGIIVLTILYRKLMIPVWLAGIATLMFLLDDNHFVPILLIAARNSTISWVFGLIVLLCHHQWRSKNSVIFAVASQVFLVIALLSSEAGIAVAAYLFAYAVSIEQSTWKKKLLSLAPATVVIIAWRVIYNALGYGFVGGGVYVDPVNEPLLYLMSVFERAPILLMGVLGWQPADLHLVFSDSSRIIMMSISVLFLLFAFIIFWPLLKNNKLARFFTIGMVLSVLPFCATMPASRNSLYPCIGAMGLVALFLHWLITKAKTLPKSRTWKTGAWLLCAIFILSHIIHGGLAHIFGPRVFMQAFIDLQATMDLGPEKPVEGKKVIFLSSAAPLFASFSPMLNAYREYPQPEQVFVLAAGFESIEVTREDSNALRLKAPNGNLLRLCREMDFHYANMMTIIGDILRPVRFKFEAGEVISNDEFSVQVVSVDDQGMPSEILLTFNSSLDDSDYYGVYFDWRKWRYENFSMPPIGQTKVLEGVINPTLKQKLRFLLTPRE